LLPGAPSLNVTSQNIRPALNPNKMSTGLRAFSISGGAGLGFNDLKFGFERNKPKNN